MRFESEEVAAAYLAGIIDGEGHVADRRYGIKRSRYIEIVNTDKLILDATTDACDQLGIDYITRYRERDGDALIKSRKDIYTITISRSQDMEIVKAKVPLQSVKREKLAESLKSYRKAPPYARVKELVDAGAKGKNIAAEFDVPMSTAQLWIRKVKAGIMENKQAGRPRGRVWTDEERAKRLG